MAVGSPESWVLARPNVGAPLERLVEPSRYAADALIEQIAVRRLIFLGRTRNPGVIHWRDRMHASEQSRFEVQYQQHLTALKLQGKADATIDSYARAADRRALRAQPG